MKTPSLSCSLKCDPSWLAFVPEYHGLSLQSRAYFLLEILVLINSSSDLFTQVLTIPDPELPMYLHIAVAVLPFPESEAWSSEEGAETGTFSLRPSVSLLHLWTWRTTLVMSPFIPKNFPCFEDCFAQNKYGYSSLTFVSVSMVYFLHLFTLTLLRLCI